jgi:CRP-like cAMP-binding protein
MDFVAHSANRILAMLPQSEREQFCRRADAVNLAPGAVLCDPGRPCGHVYFPNAGVLSCVVILSDGSVVEAAAIGNEGMAGIALLLDDGPSPLRIVQQVPGETLRVSAAAFRTLLAENERLYESVKRFTLAVVQQCGQNVACRAHHEIRQRMCRWLLGCSDRAGANEFELTQEYLGQMLGVRRQTVGITAQRLQESGWISYRRGRMAILDRAALEETACECYAVCKEAYNRVMQLS